MPAAPQRQTMSVSGPKVRIDAGEAMSTVVDHETNERFGLLHEMKVVVHEPFKDAEENKKRGSEKGAGASTRAANDGAAKEAETLTKPTGRKQKINGFDVEEYVPTKVDSRAKRFWVTKEMKDEFALRAALTSGYAGSSDFRPMRSVLAALPGVAVRLEFETAAGWKTTATFVSAEQQEVDPAIFEVPEGYTEMKP